MNVRQTRKQLKPKQKVDIMDMISNAYLNKNRFYQKQPKIRPRIGIFGNSLFTTARRANADEKEDVAISKRIKARLEGNLGVLLCQSDSEVRPQKAESCINLPVQSPGLPMEAWQYGQPKDVQVPIKSRTEFTGQRQTIVQQMDPKNVPAIDLRSNSTWKFPQNNTVVDFAEDRNTLEMNIRAQPQRLNDANLTFDFNSSPAGDHLTTPPNNGDLFRAVPEVSDTTESPFRFLSSAKNDTDMSNVNDVPFDFTRPTVSRTDFFQINSSPPVQAPDNFDLSFRSTTESTSMEKNNSFNKQRREYIADDYAQTEQSLCVNVSTGNTHDPFDFDNGSHSNADQSSQFSLTPLEFHESMGQSAKDVRDRCFPEWNHRNADTTTTNIIWDLRRLALANDPIESRTTTTTVTNFFSEYPQSTTASLGDYHLPSTSNNDFFKSPEHARDFNFSDDSQAEPRPQSTLNFF